VVRIIGVAFFCFSESGIGGYRFTTVWREETSFARNQQLQRQAVDQ
jgi:hypothetical protein